MKRETILIVCSVFCAVVWAQPAPASATAASQAAARKPRIHFDETVYDFGTSRVETVSGVFHFQNAGDADLRMGKVSTTCGCTVAVVKPEVLQPGEQGELSFTLHLGRNRALLQKQITVECNDQEQPKTRLTIQADYIPLFEIKPSSFYVTLRLGEPTNLVARVTRTDGQPLKLFKLTPTASWLEARFVPEPGSTNATIRIDATIKPEGSPRYFSELLNAFVDGFEQTAFNLPISGRINGELVLMPESVYWPITDPNKATKTRRILVTSSRAEKLEVKQPSSSIKELVVEAAPNQDGKSVEIVATLLVLPKQTITGVIRFETNVPSLPKVELPVTINVANQ